MLLEPPVIAVEELRTDEDRSEEQRGNDGTSPIKHPGSVDGPQTFTDHAGNIIALPPRWCRGHATIGLASQSVPRQTPTFTSNMRVAKGSAQSYHNQGQEWKQMPPLRCSEVQV